MQYIYIYSSMFMYICYKSYILCTYDMHIQLTMSNIRSVYQHYEMEYCLCVYQHYVSFESTGTLKRVILLRGCIHEDPSVGRISPYVGGVRQSYDYNTIESADKFRQIGSMVLQYNLASCHAFMLIGSMILQDNLASY